MGRYIVWTEERLDEASRLWGQGLTAARIAEQLGVTLGSFLGTSSLQRDRFPMRMKAKSEIEVIPAPSIEMPAPVVAPEPVVRRTYIAGKWVEHVKRTTISGAVVTLPRVSFIDGGREFAD